MADPRLDDLRALRNMIDEAHDILTTTKLPQGRAERSVELLRSALRLANDLIATPQAPAVELGKRGGLKTAERGPDYFKKIAGMRKTRAGGRPRKTAS